MLSQAAVVAIAALTYVASGMPVSDPAVPALALPTAAPLPGLPISIGGTLLSIGTAGLLPSLTLGGLPAGLLPSLTLGGLPAAVSGLTGLIPTSLPQIIIPLIPSKPVQPKATPGVPAPLGPGLIDLGTSKDFVLFAAAGISNTGASNITGDIAISPYAASSLTGFGLVYGGGPSSNSSFVDGEIFAADYAAPTPKRLTTALGDVGTAFATVSKSKDKPDGVDLGGGEIGGMSFKPGFYKWGSAVTVSKNFTLVGTGGNDTWLFAIGGVLTLNPGVSSILNGSAQASNIFYQVDAAANLLTNAHLDGILSSGAVVSLLKGSSLNGRAYAQAAMVLDDVTVNAPKIVALTTAIPAAAPASGTCLLLPPPLPCLIGINI